MKSLRSLWPYLRSRRGPLALGLLCVLGATAMQGLVPWFLGTAIDSVRRAYSLAGLMVAAALIGGVFRFGMREILNGVSRHVEYDLRNALFTHLERLDATYYGRTRTGDIMARLTNDLSAVRMAAGPAIMYLVNTIVGGLIALAFMIHISPRLTALAVLPMVLVPPIMVRLGRVIHQRFEAVQDHFGTLTTHVQENVSGTRIVRAYQQESDELVRFGKLNDEYLVRNMRLAYLYGAMNPTFSLLAGLSAVVVLGVGGVLTVRGAITLGEFVAYGFFLVSLTWPLIALGWVINLFERGAASMGRLNEIFAVRSALTDASDGLELPPLAPGVRGRTVEFRNVGFYYPVRDQETPRWVLRGVSFTVPAGSTLGVVGATGSGKSALIDLIPRLYDPQEGEILMDGVPIRALRLDALRREIGIVPQESLLFSDTIAANLAYGRPESSDTIGDVAAPEVVESTDGQIGIDEDTRWAAQVAQLDTTVQEFPGGYGTILGERGINLSGGQKQRAALARALARRPSVVLLDDALSAVDTNTEAEILHALRDAVTGRTAAIASHRISAIRDATSIVVLDGGRVVEQGRHDELLALGGRYWSLLRRQQLVDAIEDDAA